MLKAGELAREAEGAYINGKEFLYEHVTHHKTFTVNKATESIINENINVPRRSMKGLLLLFTEPYAGGARDSEKFFNPDITSVKITVDGIPNKIFSQGMESRDMWHEARRHFGSPYAEAGESFMNAKKFYTDDKFGLFIDLRSMSDKALHGSGLRLVNTKDGVHLEIERTTGGSGTVKCFIFIVSDAQLVLVNRELESIGF